MKSMDRHELSTNQLADVLGNWVIHVRPYISHILIAIIVVVVGVILIVNRTRESRRQVDEAALAFPAALSAGGEFRPGADAPKVLDRQIEALDAFLAKYPSSSVNHLVEKGLADRLYDRALLTWAAAGDVAKIDADLARAKEIYTRLAGRNDRIGLQSQFGLACILAEQGNRKEAEEQLIALAKDNPGSAIETLANQRLDVLLHSKPLKFGPEPKPVAAPPPVSKIGNQAPKIGGEAPKSSGEAPKEGPAAPQPAPSPVPPEGAVEKPEAAAPQPAEADKPVESPK